MADRPPDQIPIFPLSTVVLYPTTSVPLYIFEPRYRAMVKDALEGDQRIGMVAVDPADALHMEGDPPVYPVGCEGRIIHSDANPDGTYSILLAATRRFRIVDEPPRTADRLYRVARVETLNEPGAECADGEVKMLRERVIDDLSTLLERISPEDSSGFSRTELASVDDRHLANALCQGISFATFEKQQLLESHTTLDRYDLLDNLIRFRLAEVEHSGGSDPGVVQ
jgi:hypothetical protein